MSCGIDIFPLPTPTVQQISLQLSHAGPFPTYTASCAVKHNRLRSDIGRVRAFLHKCGLSRIEWHICTFLPTQWVFSGISKDLWNYLHLELMSADWNFPPAPSNGSFMPLDAIISAHNGGYLPTTRQQGSVISFEIQDIDHSIAKCNPSGSQDNGGTYKIGLLTV